MKKLILIPFILIALFGFSQSVSPGFGQGKVAETQSRVLTDGGDIYPNCASSQIDELKRADIWDKVVLDIRAGVGAKAGTLYATSDAATGDLTSIRNSIISINNSGNFVENIAINYPAFDYSGGCPYVNLAIVVTQLITYVESFDNVYWSLDGATLTSGQASPSADYPLGAFKLVEDGTTGLHKINTSTITTSATTHSYSIYAKQGENSKISVWDDFESGGVKFDLSDGSVYDETAGFTGKIELIVNGWYRCSMTVTKTVTNGQISVYMYDDSWTISYVGTVGDGVYIFGANLTATDYAHAFIYDGTEGGTTSTISDQLNASGTAAMFQNVNSSGTMSLEIAAHSDDLSERVIALSDGTTDNCVRLYYSSTTNQIVGDVYVGAALQAQMTYTLTDETNFYDCTIRWKENDFSLWVEGAEVATDVSGSTFGASVLTTFAFDDGAGGNDFYGKVKRGFISEEINDTQAATLK